MSRNICLYAILIASFFTFLLPAPVFAQDQPDGPIYIVSPGDTLGLIASRFNVSIDDLISANDIADPNAIDIGTELVIPGLEGISGTLVTYVVPLGENLRSISLRNHITPDTLVRLNRISTPAELYAGTSLIVPQADNGNSLAPIMSFTTGTTPLEAAVLTGQSSWSLSGSNDLKSYWGIIPGEVVYAPANEEQVAINPISDAIKEFSISPLPLSQGTTIEVSILTTQPIELQGSLIDYPLNFFEKAPNEYVSLTGIHVQEPVGLAQLSLSGKSNDGQFFSFQQDVLLQPGYFGDQQYLSVDEELINADIIAAEDETISHIINAANPERYFEAPINWPTDEPCVNTYFGVGRVYNGTYDYFHNGLDLAVCADNLNIYAITPGVVAFTGELPIKGNYTLIDHGWGVYSAYAHQSLIAVSQGDRVDAGQKIGEIGSTGRSLGPHLHWEMWVNGVQVNPIDWLENTYP